MVEVTFEEHQADLAKELETIGLLEEAIAMKPEEAIRCIKSEMWGDGYDFEFYSLAIEALEKQMPKKPAIKTETFAITVDGNELVRYTAHCPNCGIRILFPRQKEGNYCDYCGQKFDWSEVE